jgi:hypothetical protein
MAVLAREPQTRRYRVAAAGAARQPPLGSHTRIQAAIVVARSYMETRKDRLQSLKSLSGHAGHCDGYVDCESERHHG